MFVTNDHFFYKMIQTQFIPTVEFEIVALVTILIGNSTQTFRFTLPMETGLKESCHFSGQYGEVGWLWKMVVEDQNSRSFTEYLFTIHNYINYTCQFYLLTFFSKLCTRNLKVKIKMKRLHLQTNLKNILLAVANSEQIV